MFLIKTGYSFNVGEFPPNVCWSLTAFGLDCLFLHKNEKLWTGSFLSFFLFFSKALQMPFLVEFLWAVQIGQNRPGFQGSWTSVRDEGWGHEHNLICLPLSPVLLLHLSLEWWPWIWSLSHSVFRRETSCFLWGWKSNCYLEVWGGRNAIHLCSLSNFPVLTARFCSLSIIGDYLYHFIFIDYFSKPPLLLGV